jgi:hypothetical protein
MRSAVLAAVLLGLVVPSAHGDPGAFAVRVDGPRLTVEARATPLSEVLAEIGRQSGIEIYVERSRGAQLSAATVEATFTGAPLDEGLRRVLRSHNFVFRYSAKGLAEVWVYAEGGDRRDFDRLASAAPAARSAGRAHGAGKDGVAGGGREWMPDAARRAREPRTRAPAREPRKDAGLEPGEVARLRAEVLDAVTPEARMQALQQLVGAVPDDSLRDTAVAVLERERSGEVLDVALDVLYGMPSVPLAPLLDLVRSARAPDMRVRAFDLLEVHAKDPRVHDLYRALARSDPDQVVRERATMRLEELGLD